MSNKSKAYVIWYDQDIGRPEYCLKIKTVFAKTIVSYVDLQAASKDDATIEDYVTLELSTPPFSYETETISLFAFNNREECIQHLIENKNQRIFFIVSYTIGKKLIPYIIDSYPEIFQKSNNHRYRSVYILQNNSGGIDPIWRMKYSEYMLCFPDENGLIKSVINDIGYYFIKLGEKQYEKKTLSSIRHALEYFSQVKTLMKQAFNDDCPWQCRLGMASLNTFIAQCESDINNMMLGSKSTVNTSADNDIIHVYLRLPSSQTEVFKNFHVILKQLFDTYLTEGHSQEDYLLLLKNNKAPTIVQCLIDSSDELTLKHICSSNISPAIYLLGKEPDTPQARQEFYTKYPQVCAISDDPEGLAMKIGMDVALKSRIMGDKCTRGGDKKGGTRSFDQCIELLKRMKELTCR